MKKGHSQAADPHERSRLQCRRGLDSQPVDQSSNLDYAVGLPLNGWSGIPRMIAGSPYLLLKRHGG
jgi:hypothetical protein